MFISYGGVVPSMTLTRDSEVMISEDIYWIGGDDRTANIFEGAFPIPEGVSYNSYVIMDEKTALLDTWCHSPSNWELDLMTH